jgi:putative SOS response-associated peptidase YedK
MCGRYNLTAPPEAVRDLFGYREQPNFPPRENISPTEPIAVVRHRQGHPAFALMRWGLIPAWAKSPADLPLLFNARSESAAVKPAFRSAMRRRRCLIPADGFYEWKREGKARLPYLITLRNEQPFAFAGLWEHWEGKDREAIESCTIITTEANRKLCRLHDRMPVILPAELYGVWLDPELQEKESLQPLLVPYPDDEITLRPVSRFVNNVRNDSPVCIEPLHPQA